MRRSRRADLPLAGMRFAVKDNIDVAGVPTTAACEPFAYTPEQSADVVQRLLDAGAVYAGKTNLDQFATGLVGTRSPQYGACRNPIVPEFIAGGSSSGSAIAVATGEVAFALGTDTAGSGRVPAALCGIVGLKPTAGIVSNRGVVPAMASYDCVSLFTPTVGEAAAVFGVLGGRTAPQNPCRSGSGCSTTSSGSVTTTRASSSSVRSITHASSGAASPRSTRRRSVPRGALLYGSALVAERHAAFGAFAAAHPDAMDPAVAEIVRRAGEHSGADVFRALETLRTLREVTATTWSSVDGLILPTVARVPTFAEVVGRLASVRVRSSAA